MSGLTLRQAARERIFRQIQAEVDRLLPADEAENQAGCCVPIVQNAITCNRHIAGRSFLRLLRVTWLDVVRSFHSTFPTEVLAVAD